MLVFNVHYWTVPVVLHVFTTYSHVILRLVFWQHWFHWFRCSPEVSEITNAS